MARALIQVPPSVRRGDSVEVRTLIAHPMETGHRVGADGRPVARDIVRRLACRLDGELVFRAEFFPAIAANPYCAFHVLATHSGTLTVRWEGDNGFAQTESIPLVVAG